MRKKKKGKKKKKKKREVKVSSNYYNGVEHKPVLAYGKTAAVSA